MGRCNLGTAPLSYAAQQGSAGRVLLVVAACCGLSPAMAQDAVAGRGLSFGGSLSALVTSSVSERSGGRDGDLVAELQPAFFLNSRAGRVVGSLSYSLSLTYRQNEFDGQNVHNQLSASFSGELIERHAYLDVAANVSQQAASANGQQSAPGSTRYNANQIEVGTLSLSPYLRGVMGSAVNYELRLNASGTNGRRSVAADSTTTGGSLSLSSAVAGSLLGWGLTASHVKQDYRAGRESASDRYSASLTYLPDPDLTLNLRGGQESNDVASVVRTTYNNWGAGFTWRPNPRTRAQFQLDERYFGKSYQILVDHRLASLSFQFTSTRDASNGTDPASSGQSITIYQALDRLLAAQYPDPVDRDAQIRLLLGSIDPNQLVGGGGITSGVTIARRNQLTATYSYLRVSASAQIYANSSETADSALPAVSSKQWGYIGTLTYRLSPTANLGMTGSRMLTKATASLPSTNLKSASLSWTDQVARRTTAAVNLRYSVFNSTTDPYREAAISASLSQRF